MKSGRGLARDGREVDGEGDGKAQNAFATEFTH